MKEISRLQNLAKRNSLSKQQVERKSQAIQERFLDLPEFKNAQAIMLYFSIKNEAKTKGIIEKTLQLGKKVVLPVTNFENRKIVPTELGSLKELKKTRQGLFEPTGKNQVKTSELQLVVVPGIAFDTQGSRIGTGKGFYDSLLRRTTTKVPLVGLCFEENLEEALPKESHDVKMDIIVTDKKVIRCKK